MYVCIYVYVYMYVYTLYIHICLFIDRERERERDYRERGMQELPRLSSQERTPVGGRAEGGPRSASPRVNNIKYYCNRYSQTYT